jgi:hypothetical protein
MDVNRKIITRMHMNDDKDDGYVKADMPELISLMWEITENVWSFMRDQNAQQRLQRNVAALTGRRS